MMFVKRKFIIAEFWLAIAIAMGNVATNIRDKGISITQLNEKDAIMERSSQKTTSKATVRSEEAADKISNECKATGV
ncbi:MAG: hypothetical protein QXX18_07615 [Candidatus Jordarchaeales archaeon]